MKAQNFKLFFLISILVLSFPFTACAHTRILETLPTGEDIHKVYISKSMITMVKLLEGNFGGGDLKKYNLDDILTSINSIEVYVCDKEKFKGEVLKGFDKIVEEHKGEVLVEAEDNGQVSRIYLIFPENINETPNGLLISNISGSSIEIIALDGKIDIEKLVNM